MFYGQFGDPLGSVCTLELDGLELSSHSPSTIITNPNPKHIQACYSILPKHIEGLSYTCTALGTVWGLGNISERSVTLLFLKHQWKRWTTCSVHSTNTKQENHCSIDETNYMQDAWGRLILSGDTCEILKGRYFGSGLKGWYEREKSCENKGITFCKAVA